MWPRFASSAGTGRESAGDARKAGSDGWHARMPESSLHRGQPLQHKGGRGGAEGEPEGGGFRGWGADQVRVGAEPMATAARAAARRNKSAGACFCSCHVLATGPCSRVTGRGWAIPVPQPPCAEADTTAQCRRHCSPLYVGTGKIELGREREVRH